jgi:hypothetical protein
MAAEFDLAEFITDLNRLVEFLPDHPAPPASWSIRMLGDIASDLKMTIGRLQQLLNSLDPVKQPQVFFDPSDPLRVGEMVAGALVLQSAVPLSEIPKMYGSGIYALYYRGPFKAYQPISNVSHPIYVGKADPKDGHARTPEQQGTRLYIRLMEHLKTITLSNNLDVKDFDCRYLAVVSGWQEAAESHLIKLYRPIWNNEIKICFGFGKHGDAAKTRSNKRSPWDMMHPGRLWAQGNVPNDRSVDQIKDDIAKHFKKHPPVQP